MSIEPYMRPPSGAVSCVECGRRYPEHAPACSLSFTFPEPAAAALPDTVAAAVRLALSVLSGDAYGEPNTEQATADALSILTHHADQCDELIEWADLAIVYTADPRDLATTIKRLATQLRSATGGVPSGDYLPLGEMIGLLAEAKDRRDTVGARIAKPGFADPELVTEWGEAETAEWRIVDEIVGAARSGEPGYPPVPTRPEPAQ